MDRQVVLQAILDGDLIPITVFAAGLCGENCPHCETHAGYGLCDKFSVHSPAGSDCNRAVNYMLRPSDEWMKDPAMRAAFEAVLDESF